MELEEIYRPIRENLDEIEERLKSTGDVDSPGLSELLDYGLKGGGKRVRPILVLLSGRIFGCPKDRLMSMGLAVEVMHLATLVHDDTIDNSAVRWGRPTINTLWGTEQAVLLGDYLFSYAGYLTSTTDNLRVIKLLPKTIMIISSGEIAQSRSLFNLDQTEENYFHRIFSKTASLFVMSTVSGAVLAGAPEESIQILQEYGHNLGIAFQIVDDILDYIGTEDEMGKPVGSDLAQGTLTLPGMLLLEQYPYENPVEKLFREKGGDSYITEAIEMVRNSPIIDQCFDVAADYRNRACCHLDQLPDNEFRRSLYGLADFIIHRRR
ncbi:MAG TPA: polyprenyl synthetase family protein [Dehalococcoidia bacterium]|nr:polyprenyl synthetase family protein [Dehalococcoidia bacterium]